MEVNDGGRFISSVSYVDFLGIGVCVYNTNPLDPCVFMVDLSQGKKDCHLVGKESLSGNHPPKGSKIKVKLSRSKSSRTLLPLFPGAVSHFGSGLGGLAGWYQVAKAPMLTPNKKGLQSSSPECL